jgi:hypothetical protein
MPHKSSSTRSQQTDAEQAGTFHGGYPPRLFF